MNKCIYRPDTACPLTQDSCHDCLNRSQDGTQDQRLAEGRQLLARGRKLLEEGKELLE